MIDPQRQLSEGELKLMFHEKRYAEIERARVTGRLQQLLGGEVRPVDERGLSDAEVVQVSRYAQDKLAQEAAQARADLAATRAELEARRALAQGEAEAAKLRERIANQGDTK